MPQKRTQNKDPFQTKALRVFKDTSENVSAYKQFLKNYGVNAKQIAKSGDWESIPLMEKDTYLKAFPLLQLVPKGKLPPMISASSGSSGKPFYWPRGDAQEKFGADFHRTIYNDIFKLKSKRTLAIVCFSMGNWVAGTFTLACMREIARDKGTQLTIITPGIDKDDVISTLRDFAPHFEAVILIGYPPFLMDAVLAVKDAGVSVSKYNMHFILAGENFSEKWRAMLEKSAGIPVTEKYRSVSIYGTADAGCIGHETPLTLEIRKLALKHKAFQKELYGDMSFIPTTVSYYPEQTYFELVNGELVFTAPSGIPLVRYNIKDHGALLSPKFIFDLAKKHGLEKEFSAESHKWKQPIIILKGRNDVLVTFYALNIYPENIRVGLEDDQVLDKVTGKYVITAEQTKDLRHQILKIAVELKQDVAETKELSELIGKVIFNHLIELNAEYRKLHSSIHEKAIPEITFVPHGHEQFTIKKSKHKWVKKQS